MDKAAVETWNFGECIRGARPRTAIVPVILLGRRLGCKDPTWVMCQMGDMELSIHPSRQRRL